MDHPRFTSRQHFYQHVSLISNEGMEIKGTLTMIELEKGSVERPLIEIWSNKFNNN